MAALLLVTYCSIKYRIYDHQSTIPKLGGKFYLISQKTNSRGKANWLEEHPRFLVLDPYTVRDVLFLSFLIKKKKEFKYNELFLFQ